jgi:hypothetical protein
VSTSYPSGVKVNYRAYSQGKVIEIIDGDSNDAYSFNFREVEVNTHPSPTADSSEDGMYLLAKLPDGSKTFQPQAFVADSRAKLVSLSRHIIKKYGNTFEDLESDWSHWVDNIAPQSDDACEHIKVSYFDSIRVRIVIIVSYLQSYNILL